MGENIPMLEEADFAWLILGDGTRIRIHDEMTVKIAGMYLDRIEKEVLEEENDAE